MKDERRSEYLTSLKGGVGHGDVLLNDLLHLAIKSFRIHAITLGPGGLNLLGMNRRGAEKVEGSKRYALFASSRERAAKMFGGQVQGTAIACNQRPRERQGNKSTWAEVSYRLHKAKHVHFDVTKSSFLFVPCNAEKTERIKQRKDGMCGHHILLNHLQINWFRNVPDCEACEKRRRNRRERTLSKSRPER